MRTCVPVCVRVSSSLRGGTLKAHFASPKGFLDHLLRQVMGLDGLIEAKFSSTVAAPHRVPSSSAHCSIKGSFRGRASSTCTYAVHTLMRDETDIFKLRKGEGGRKGKINEKCNKKKKFPTAHLHLQETGDWLSNPLLISSSLLCADGSFSVSWSPQLWASSHCLHIMLLSFIIFSN